MKRESHGAEALPRIREAFENEKRFTLATHIDPDIDGLASELALASVLEESGKEVNIVNCDPVPSAFTFLRGSQKIITLKDDPGRIHPVLIVVDTGNFSRTGYPADIRGGKVRTVINIDHHKGNEMFGDMNLVDPVAGAACLLVTELIQYLGCKIGTERAALLYAGLAADTGSFRFPNTTAGSLRTAAALADEGIDIGAIASDLYSDKTAGSMKLLSIALSSLEILNDGKIAVMSLSDDDFLRSGARHEDSEGFSTFAKSVKGSLVAVFLREAEPGIVRVSFRSDGKVDVDRIARLFGGGGHAGASGARIAGKLEEVRKEVVARIAPFV